MQTNVMTRRFFPSYPPYQEVNKAAATKTIQHRSVGPPCKILKSLRRRRTCGEYASRAPQRPSYGSSLFSSHGPASSFLWL